jgi:hypothetical protein
MRASKPGGGCADAALPINIADARARDVALIKFISFVELVNGVIIHAGRFAGPK